MVWVFDLLTLGWLLYLLLALWDLFVVFDVTMAGCGCVGLNSVGSGFWND